MRWDTQQKLKSVVVLFICYSTVTRLVASKTVRRESFFPTPVREDTRGFTENCIYPRVGQKSKIKKILSERLRQK